jgi:hypothetical protein
MMRENKSGAELDHILVIKAGILSEVGYMFGTEDYDLMG